MAQLAAFWAKLTMLVSTIRFSDIVDILIVAYLIYNVIMLIRKTNSYRLAQGVLLILIALWLSGVLKLTMFNRLLQKTVELGLIALVIIFQPELRRTLERMGQSTMWANLLVGNRRSDPSLRGAWQSAVVAICDAAEQLSDTRTGALMVLERNNNLDEIIRTGTPMHADVIPEMLGTIFYEGTPLHDGAVVIRDGVIVAAGCVLPLSNNLEMGKDMGTRHRAGLGMSENSDAIVVIVSEETGIISMAKNGVLIRRLDRQNLFNLLQEEIVPPAEDEEADISPLQKLLRKGGALNHAKPE